MEDHIKEANKEFQVLSEKEGKPKDKLTYIWTRWPSTLVAEGASGGFCLMVRERVAAGSRRFADACRRAAKVLVYNYHHHGLFWAYVLLCVLITTTLVLTALVLAYQGDGTGEPGVGAQVVFNNASFVDSTTHLKIIRGKDNLSAGGDNWIDTATILPGMSDCAFWEFLVHEE